MASIVDERGFNQGFELVKKSTEVRMRRRADYMIGQMDLNGPKDILEIGCGTGEVSYWIAEKTGKHVLGTDLSPLFIENAKRDLKLPNLDFEVLDFSNPQQVAGRKFDYIIGNGILHHLYHHLDNVLPVMRDLLKDKGKMIFIEPNIYNPYCAVIFNIARDWANLEPDEMAFSKGFITEKLKVAGYANIKVEYKDFLLPGVPDGLIQPSISIGNVLEKLPIIKQASQSIFISAAKN